MARFCAGWGRGALGRRWEVRVGGALGGGLGLREAPRVTGVGGAKETVAEDGIQFPAGPGGRDRRPDGTWVST